ncbi:hypothetical protein BDW74DRAFT_162330 [Aspergillus multicolor]|uniref:uncharacterized protein n=1 Tax=Aspergillus multicolor TaxID=41759 RepID=UPI003CCDB6E5
MEAEARRGRHVKRAWMTWTWIWTGRTDGTGLHFLYIFSHVLIIPPGFCTYQCPVSLDKSSQVCMVPSLMYSRLILSNTIGRIG